MVLISAGEYLETLSRAEDVLGRISVETPCDPAFGRV